MNIMLEVIENRQFSSAAKVVQLLVENADISKTCV
jgi:hypothetical protein